MGLETGAPLAVLRLGNGLILFPENRRFEELCQRVGAAFGAANVTQEELLSGLRDARGTRLRDALRANEKLSEAANDTARPQGEVTARKRIRLFLDSNVITGGIIAPWGLDKAVLSICAAGICRLVLAEVVRDEVNANVLRYAERLASPAAQELIADYHRLLMLTGPEIVPATSGSIGPRQPST